MIATIAELVLGRARRNETPGRLSRTLALVVVSLFATSTAKAETVGTPWTGNQAVQQRTAEIMDREEHEHEPRRPRPIPLRREDDFQLLLPNPESPDVPSSPPPDSGASSVATVGNPQTYGVNFTAATLSDTSAFPPDTMGAAGPTQFIIALNGRIRSFNKVTGVADGVINVDTDVFFQSVMTSNPNGNFTSDPRIRYDRLSRRWFIIMIDVPGTQGTLPNRIMIAVSDSAIISPSTVWSFFQFQHDLVSPAGDGGKFADYPTLGIDANALYIGVNIFGTRGLGSFSSTTGYVIRKSSVLGAGPIVVTAFRNLVVKDHGVLTGPYTPQGVDNYDPAATEGYFIGADPSYAGRINLRRVSNPGGTPSISANVVINVPANGNTINVPHLGNTGGSAGNLDGLDVRLMAAHLRNGRLWTTANLAVNNVGSPSGTDTRNGVRWYELQGIATGQTPSVVQSGTVYEPSPSNTTDQRNYWMGSIMVSGQGHAAMGFSVAGAQERINAGTVGRLALDPLGTMRTPALYTASTSAYNPPNDPGSAQGRRWGDYSYTCLDPNDDMTMWTIQEWCHAANSYAVQVVRLLAPPPAAPASCSPASLAAGTNNVSVIVTGTLTNGSGFFDPGPGFSNRIAAAFSASGITVNSIQYTDPAHITLNVSVAANATAGAHNLTVTNPDGQSATSVSGLLTITGGNNPPTISSIGNQTINEDSATSSLSFTIGDTETPPGALGFAATSSNTNLVPQSGIALGGGGTTRTVTITPAADEFGSATITLTVTDAASASASATFLLTVNPVNDSPVLTSISDRTLNEGDTLSVTNTATDLDSAALTFSLAVAPPGSAIDSATGVFTWTPTEAQGPSTNPVSVVVSDNGSPSLSVTQSFSIVVNEVNSAPTLAPIVDRTIHQGMTLSITNLALDLDVPVNQLTYSLSNAPAGATINASVFTWTPAPEQVNSTNTITVVVSDDGSPSLSDAETFTVTVLAPPTIVSISLFETNVSIVWTAIAGTTYRVQYKSDLQEMDWHDLPEDVVAASDTAMKSDAIISVAQRFYRILVRP